VTGAPVDRSASSTSTTAAATEDGIVVRDGMPKMDADYEAAVKKCESVNFNRTQCINTAKQTYGRI
jgi:hypothetical protein